MSRRTLLLVVLLVSLSGLVLAGPIGPPNPSPGITQAAADLRYWTLGSGAQAVTTGKVLTVGGGTGTLTELGNLTIGQTAVGDNVNYQLNVRKQGTAGTPGTYTGDTPGIEVKTDAADGPAAPELAGLLNLNAQRIGTGDPNAANMLFLSLHGDNGNILTVNGAGTTVVGNANTGKLTLDTGAAANADITEAGVDLSSAAGTTWAISNSGAGVCALTVDGAIDGATTLAIGTADAFTVSAAGAVATTGTLGVGGAAGFAAGTVGAPSMAWTADQDGTGTGFYRSAANVVDVTLNGVQSDTFAVAGPTFRGSGAGGAAAGTVTINTTATTGGGILMCGSSNRCGAFYESDGAGPRTTFVWAGVPDSTGSGTMMQLLGNTSLVVGKAGEAGQLQMNSTYNAAAPPFSGTLDLDTGCGVSAANTWACSTSGVARTTLDASTFAVALSTTVAGTVSVTTTSPSTGETITDTGASGALSGPILALVENDGAALDSGHALGQVTFKGSEDGSSTLDTGARILARALSLFSGSNAAAALDFATVTTGTRTLTTRMTIDETGLLVASTAIASVAGTCTTPTSQGIDAHGALQATSCNAGETIVATFGSTKASTIRCVASASNSAAATGLFFVTYTTTTVTVTSVGATSGPLYTFLCEE